VLGTVTPAELVPALEDAAKMGITVLGVGNGPASSLGDKKWSLAASDSPRGGSQPAATSFDVTSDNEHGPLDVDSSILQSCPLSAWVPLGRGDE
jgi:hypothetical protein